MYDKDIPSCKANIMNGVVEGIQLNCLLQKVKYFDMDFWIYIDDSSGFLQFDNEYCVGGRNHKQRNSIKLNAVFSISLANVAIWMLLVWLFLMTSEL